MFTNNFVKSSRLISSSYVLTSSYRHLSVFANEKVDRSYTPPSVNEAVEHFNFSELVKLLKHRGFIWPGSEHYGGLKGTFDYGPLGLPLKQNLMRAWSDTFIKSTHNCFPIDSSITLHPKVWETAGHVENFVDPLVECKTCHVRYRLDKLAEEYHIEHSSDMTDFNTWSDGIMSQLLQNRKFKCTSCGNREFATPRMFNLLMETACGSVPTYLRPETAQGIFMNYERVRTSMRKTLPFGVGQIGKAFRNEISPRDFTYRMREFEQMELEYFCAPHEAPQAYTELVGKCRDFLSGLGVRSELMRTREYHGAELAHYAAATTDIEFHFPFGWGELWGIANRGDFDLRRHGVGLTTIASAEHDPDPAAPASRSYPHQFYPHVVEPSVGVDRLLLAVVHSALRSEELEGRRRTVMNLHPDLAPIKLAVLPITKAPELRALARELYDAVSQHWAADLDQAGSIGKRYARNDEVGTPWCVTVDPDSLADQTVTVRSRDSRLQVRMGLTELMHHVRTNTRLPL